MAAQFDGDVADDIESLDALLEPIRRQQADLGCWFSFWPVTRFRNFRRLYVAVRGITIISAFIKLTTGTRILIPHQAIVWPVETLLDNSLRAIL